MVILRPLGAGSLDYFREDAEEAARNLRRNLLALTERWEDREVRERIQATPHDPYEIAELVSEWWAGERETIRTVLASTVEMEKA